MRRTPVRRDALSTRLVSIAACVEGCDRERRRGISVGGPRLCGGSLVNRSPPSCRRRLQGLKAPEGGAVTEIGGSRGRWRTSRSLLG